jgi:hypothetical protein
MSTKTEPIHWSIAEETLETAMMLGKWGIHGIAAYIVLSVVLGAAGFAYAFVATLTGVTLVGVMVGIAVAPLPVVAFGTYKAIRGAS